MLADLGPVLAARAPARRGERLPARQPRPLPRVRSSVPAPRCAGGPRRAQSLANATSRTDWGSDAWRLVRETQAQGIKNLPHNRPPRVIPALLLGGCATTATRTTTWGGAPYGEGWARYGRVESIRETVRTVQGDPGAGAVAGAIIGGLLFGGRSPAHTVAGAIGAQWSAPRRARVRARTASTRCSSGSTTARSSHSCTRTSSRSGIGDPVVLTSQGLSRR